MRVLLDECLPRRLKADLPDHEVRTAQDEGWSGMKNGALLQVASGRFDVFLTVDRNIPFQQNLRGLKIGVLAMMARHCPKCGQAKCRGWVANQASSLGS